MIHRRREYISFTLAELRFTGHAMLFSQGFTQAPSEDSILYSDSGDYKYGYTGYPAVFYNSQLFCQIPAILEISGSGSFYLLAVIVLKNQYDAIFFV